MKEKKGISLIVLIVTIIVMIIISGAIILSLTETNIIDQAESAVEKHNKSEMKTAATLAYSEWLLSDQSRNSQSYIEEQLIKNGVLSEEDKGKYYITETGQIEEVDQDAFIFVVDISKDNYTYELANVSKSGDFSIDWGDGTVDTQDTLSILYRHTYISKGIYEIKIKGNFTNLENSSGDDKDIESVIAIKSFGNLGLQEIYLDAGSRCKYFPSPNENSFKNLTYFDTIALGLEEIPDYFFKGAPIETVAFTSTDTLKHVPENVFEGCSTLTDVYRIFYDCKNLTGYVPALWDEELYPNITNYTEAFTGTSVTHGYDGTEIPDDWK